MSALSEQLPWQQLTEQAPESSGEQVHADDSAKSFEAGPGMSKHLLSVAPSSQVGSFAEQQLQRQGLGLLNVTNEGDATGTSSIISDVGQTQVGEGDEETAAKAAYRQWSESFEAGRVRAEVCNQQGHVLRIVCIHAYPIHAVS